MPGQEAQQPDHALLIICVLGENKDLFKKCLSFFLYFPPPLFFSGDFREAEKIMYIFLLVAGSLGGGKEPATKYLFLRRKEKFRGH